MKKRKCAPERTSGIFRATIFKGSGIAMKGSIIQNSACVLCKIIKLDPRTLVRRSTPEVSTENDPGARSARREACRPRTAGSPPSGAAARGAAAHGGTRTPPRPLGGTRAGPEAGQRQTSARTACTMAGTTSPTSHNESRTLDGARTEVLPQAVRQQVVTADVESCGGADP